MSYYIISATNPKCNHKWSLAYVSLQSDHNDWKCDKCGAVHSNTGNPYKPWNDPNNKEIFAQLNA